MSLGNIFYDAMLPLFASPSVTFINEATGPRIMGSMKKLAP